jgi:MFS family permease
LHLVLIGYYGVSFNIASSFGPALMLFMRDHLGYQSIFYATGAISLLALVFGSTLNYEKTAQKQKAAEKKRLTWDSIVEKTAIPSALVLILISVPNGLVNTFLVKYSESLSIGGIGLYFTFNAIAMILSRLFAGKLCDRVGAQRVLPPGMILIFGGLLIIAFARALIFFLIAGMMLGFGNGILFPTIQAFVMKSAPLDRRGAASATYYSSQDLGQGAGSIVGGMMTEAIGFTVSFAIYSLFIVGAYAMFCLVLKNRITPSEE